MENMTEDEIKGYGFKNPKKLVEIINDLSNAIFRHSGVPGSYLEISNESRLEWCMMEYKKIVEDILKKHCT